MYILIKFTCLVCSLSISRLFTLSRLAVLMSTQCRPFSSLHLCHRPPLRILTEYDARLLSWLGSLRAALEVLWKWGVGLYCENIGSKIVYGVKIAL